MMASPALLTERDIRVLTLTAWGIQLDEIARLIDSDTASVNRLMTSACTKLRAKTLLEAQARAIREGLIPMEYGNQ